MRKTFFQSFERVYLTVAALGAAVCVNSFFGGSGWLSGLLLVTAVVLQLLYLKRMLEDQAKMDDKGGK